VKSLHYEKNINQSVIQEKIEAKLKQFARFNGCSYNSI
ncbi:hypothetical protein MNBD_GAMMA03-918, partial [hydrothermal vent metagenome]